MNLIEHLRRQFAYDAWANREVMAAIRASAGDERARQLMSHIVAAERLWLERLEQKPQSVPVWPKADLQWCEAQVAELSRLWTEYLQRIAAEDLGRSISYKNSKGEAWSSTIEDILTHVILHSTYHRGQIASHMRSIGQTPANTDFIHGVRQGLVE
ncbi:MAG: DinB family protein [Candidatus Sulfotelmatobacter sp.]